MTGAAGIIMWLMMGLMITVIAASAIAWAKRRTRRRTTQHPQPQAAGDNTRRRWPRRP